MGNCLNLCKDDKITYNIAIKLPHGIKYLNCMNNTVGSNINIWLHQMHNGERWNEWKMYNDQNPHGTDKGHCKGMLFWNDKHLLWIIHSVPNFPSEYKNNQLNDILDAEKIYGQSFICIKMPSDRLNDVLDQIYHMMPYIYIESSTNTRVKPNLKQINILSITKKIHHISKSPTYHVDIYDHVSSIYNCNLFVESWLRSDVMPETDKVKNIKKIDMKNNDNKWNESQDHSKWAISTEKDIVMVGDLNRMQSQMKRGGGLLLIMDDDKVCDIFRNLI